MTSTSAFVGRRRELDQLRAAVDEVLAAHGRPVLVAGEPGMGKTSLVEELSRYAEEQGMATVWASCADSEGSPPLWPWTQALRALASDDRTASTVRLEGALEGVEPDAGLLGSVDPAGTQFRLFDGIVRQFHQATAANPVLLVLDDLHWADRSSLQLLALICRSIRSSALLAIGTYRDTEVTESLGRFLADLPRDVDRLFLGGLDRDDLAALAHATTGEAVDDELVTVLHEQTAGNPFFAKELAGLLSGPGRRRDTGSVPASVREVIDRRMRRLSAPCQRVLETGAVIGREFQARLVGEAVGVPADEIAGGIDEAEAARIICAAGFDRFVFAHDLFRQVVYDGLGRARRRHLHAAVGEAIERHAGANRDAYVAELAYHFAVAAPTGDVERAVAYGRQAAARASRLVAFDETVSCLVRTLALLPDEPPTPTRAELLIELGDARWRAQDISGARAAVLEAADAARRIDEPELLARAALVYACGLGGNQPLARADRQLIALLEESLRLLDPADSVLRCRVQARLASELYLTPEESRRRELSGAAVAMAHRLDDPHALAAALYGRQVAMFGPDDLEEREAESWAILELAENAGDDELALWGHLFLVWAKAEQGLPVSDDLAACARLADRLQLPGYRAEVALRQAVVAVTAGEFDECDRLVALVNAGAATDPAAASSVMSLMALLGLLRGPLDVLEPMVVDIMAEYPDKPLWRAALTLLYAELGRLDDARRLLDGFAADNFALPRDGLWLYSGYFLAFAAFVTRDCERAERLYSMLLPHIDQAPVGAFGSMATPVGLLDATCGRYEQALSRLELGYERNVAMGNRAFAVRTRREHAAVLLLRDGEGDREEAARILVETRAEMERAGFTGFLGRTDALLAAASAGPPAPVTGELRRVASTWQVTYDGVTVPLAHSKGWDDLALLLASPGTELRAVDLVGAVEAADTGDVVDPQAMRAYRERIAELDDAIAEADRRGDAARSERALEERAAIVRQLAGAFGLGGRPRRTGDVAERARKTVTWRIRASIRAANSVHPSLGAHLGTAVRTGTYCCYEPDRPHRWVVTS